MKTVNQKKKKWFWEKKKLHFRLAYKIEVIVKIKFFEQYLKNISKKVVGKCQAAWYSRFDEIFFIEYENIVSRKTRF